MKGTWLALVAALLFGVTAPIAKRMLTGIPALQASGLLYLGAGLALGMVLLVRGARSRGEAPLARADLPVLAAVVLVGGLVGPGLLLYGLARASGTVGSLLLNLETVFTVAIAVALGDRPGRRALAGIAIIVLGACALGLDPAALGGASAAGALAIAGACLAWGVDNNLTQRLAGRDPLAIVASKGLVAGPLALLLAAAPPPPLATAAVGLIVGAFGYGASLACFVLALRHAGAARTGALFATAPFAGALVAIMWLGEPGTAAVALAGGLMALGVALLAGEHHEHEHTHAPMAHDHAHVHDEHHQHAHEGWEGPEPHAHPHAHAHLTHAHAHEPDLHHRHSHGP